MAYKCPKPPPPHANPLPGPPNPLPSAPPLPFPIPGPESGGRGAGRERRACSCGAGEVASEGAGVPRRREKAQSAWLSFPRWNFPPLNLGPSAGDAPAAEM